MTTHFPTLSKVLTITFLLSLFYSSQALAQCASSKNIYRTQHNKHTYEIVKENKTWSDAVQCAKARGGYLVRIDNKKEQDFLYTILTKFAKITNSNTKSQFGYGTVWLGGTDSLTEGKWIWDGTSSGQGDQFWSGGLNGSPVGGLYNKWGDEPDNSGNQDALSMTLETTPRNAASEWNDLDGAKNKIYYVIEIDCIRTVTKVNTSACTSYTSPSGKVWTKSGAYKDTIFGKWGCDSIFNITLSIETSNQKVDTTVCGSFMSPSGKVANLSQTVTDTLLSQGGCDSVVAFNVTVIANSGSSMSPAACNAFLAPSGKTFSQSGLYTDTIPNAKGCDSVISINLSILQSSSSVASIDACGTYVSPSGKTFVSSGTYRDTIFNNAGCDSVMTINLTLSQPTSSTISVDECNSYVSPSGKIFGASGQYMDTIPNVSGCDSVITINLSINASSSNITATVCDTYFSPSGKTVLTSGVFYDTIPNSVGCDSVMLIDLVVKERTYHTITEDVCGSYASPAGKTYTTSGIYADTIPNTQGCDSIINIDLTVTNVDTALSRTPNSATSQASGATYQWLDCDNNYAPISGETSQTYTTTTIDFENVAVEVTQNSCVDTSRCVAIRDVGIEENLFKNSITLFPNPSSGAINLEFERVYETLAITVTDVTGRTLQEGTLRNADRAIWDLPQEPGYYLVKVQSQKSQATFRVLRAE